MTSTKARSMRWTTISKFGLYVFSPLPKTASFEILDGFNRLHDDSIRFNNLLVQHLRPHLLEEYHHR